MQSTQSSPVRGPLHPDIQAQLEGHSQALQTYLPTLQGQFDNFQKHITQFEDELSKTYEQISLANGRIVAAEQALQQISDVWPTDSADITEAHSIHYNEWAFEINKYKHYKHVHGQRCERNEAKLKRLKLRLALVSRRIAIVHWRAQVLNFFSDVSQATKFPLPPLVLACRDTGHEEAFCPCNIRAAYALFLYMMPNWNLSVERYLFHPARLSDCPEPKRDSWKSLAKGIFMVVSKMHQEGK